MVNVSSDAAFWVKKDVEFAAAIAGGQGLYNHQQQYALSKLFNVWHVSYLNRKWASEGKPLIAVALHPGVVSTNLAKVLESLR